MPRNDGTGPLGNGPMTGRGLGLCNDGKAFGFGLGRRGRGLGCRRGFGRGFGRFFYDINQNPQNQKAILEKQKEILELELKDINDTLKNYSEDDEK
ncbi:DUF5320 domain-containing protein [Maledivibacter halophilus]|uniref:DUF5320 domain-containing protein n=1 Tax=Maledivibacter halophilus TaxID=36842 RepID=A0A1T5M031_9FIRM|nr:DUF5320 domain-containing protein [Maledivibacter halophilus]SKC81168.1 hypothetical protein SAMN02194393_03561 [Maledivibacter halophilus]